MKPCPIRRCWRVHHFPTLQPCNGIRRMWSTQAARSNFCLHEDDSLRAHHLCMPRLIHSEKPIGL